MTMKTQFKTYAAKAVLRGKFIALQSYLKETRKTSNRQPNFTSKTTLEKEEQKTPKLVEGKKS